METITRSRYLTASGAIITMCLAFPVPVRGEGHAELSHRQSDIQSLEVPPEASEEPDAYSQERRRHDQIRDRADILSKNPLLRAYKKQAAALRNEDDRKMEELDLLAKSAGGHRSALAKLKRHNTRMLRMVRRAQTFAGD